MLFNAEGYIVVVAYISPYEEDRQKARQRHAEKNLPFKIVYINASIDVCEKRDTKGLYKKARNGEIPQFTGISDPFDDPNADLVVNTGEDSIEACIGKLKSLVEATLYPPENFIDISTDEEGMNILQVIQQGWCPGDLKCFMNEEELIECINLRTYKGKYLQSVPLIFPIGNKDCEKVALAQNDLQNSTGKNNYIK
jgi:hypothetical protein